MKAKATGAADANPVASATEVPPTAAVADACVRLGVPVLALGLRPVIPGRRVHGPAIPARHVGSVDVFFEAVRGAPAGSILVVDNGGRLDEGCVGDLTAIEARHHGVEAMVVWGAHRDTRDLVALGMPTWSLGPCPAGPIRLDARPVDSLQRARLGNGWVARGDHVVADDDGAVAVPAAKWSAVEAMAREVAAVERKQAALAQTGTPLYDQLGFEGFLEARRADPGLTFRAHLRKRGGAIEE